MHPLDNALWTALTTSQANFAQGSGAARRYLAEIGPLGAMAQPDPAGFAAMGAILQPGEAVVLFLPSPIAPPLTWNVLRAEPLLEMVHDGRTLPAPHLDYVELSRADVPEMLALTALTKPGPFEKRTHELGTFLGMRREGELAAMAGERIRIAGYTEISAVCTHPAHLGRGYAAGLMTVLLERMRKRDEIATLHVLPGNSRAVQLYERLGFYVRATLHLLVIAKTE